MATDVNALLQELIPGVVKQVTRGLSTPAGSLISAEDLTQDMWVAALEHLDLITSHAEEGNSEAIKLILKRQAKRHIAAEQREQRTRKAALEGYETYDEEFYSVGALRRLLPMFLDGGVTERPPTGREQSWKVSGGGSGGYGDYTVVMSDIDVAFGKLSQGKQKILSRYFTFPQGSGGFTHTEIAGRMGMEPGELSSRVHHALRSLQRNLGGQSPWDKR